MAHLLSTHFSPYQIRTVQKGSPYDSSFASTLVKTIRISCLHTRHESIGRSMEDSDAYSISFALTGETRTWLPGVKEVLTTVGSQGRIFQRPAGTITVDGDDARLLNMWIPKDLVQASLQQILGDAAERNVEFLPQILPTSGAGATLRRMMVMAAIEFGDPNSSFSSPLVAARFEEFVAHTLLSGLQHNFTDFLAAQSNGAAPRNVIRALEFIKAHASEPLTIGAIAAAAGCSTRALQLAFRAWRDTTPMKELNRVRLEYAHADLLKYGMNVTVTQIAMKWGFGHPGRFAQQYAKVMGQSPSHTQRFGMSSSRAVPASLRPLQPR
jgi:AraC-like DNA-binding protein